MNFTVYTDAASSDTYGGEATCWREGSTLVVNDGERHVLYSPNGWIRVEADQEVKSFTTVDVGGAGGTAWPITVVVQQ